MSAVGEIDRRHPDYVLEHYLCPECGWWHLGNRKIRNLDRPWTHKIVHRETALLVELGERALANLLAKPSRVSYRRASPSAMSGDGTLPRDGEAAPAPGAVPPVHEGADRPHDP